MTGPLGRKDEAHPLVVFAVHYDPLSTRGDVVTPLQIPFPFSVRDTDTFEALAHRVEMLWRRGEGAGRQQAARLTLELLAQLEDEVAHPLSLADRHFHNLIAQVRRDPARDWNLDDMARHVHLSRAQFTRRFRVLFSSSPLEWVLQTRLERARYLLQETDMTQAQIGTALGFCDAAHFSHRFKKWDGRAPGALRR